MLLAVLPLFLAWRSLPSYFYCAALPLLILQAAYILPNRGSRPRKATIPAWRLQFAPPETTGLPVGIASHAATKTIHFFRALGISATSALGSEGSVHSQQQHSPEAPSLAFLPWIPPPKSIA